jgi:hypothetical protein
MQSNIFIASELTLIIMELEYALFEKMFTLSLWFWLYCLRDISFPVCVWVSTYVCMGVCIICAHTSTCSHMYNWMSWMSMHIYGDTLLQLLMDKCMNMKVYVSCGKIATYSLFEGPTCPMHISTAAFCVLLWEY